MSKLAKCLATGCLLLASVVVYAEDNTLAVDPTTDPRVQATEYERCVGSTIQCSAANAPWVFLGQVPVGTWAYTDANVPEGQTYNYRAFFWNQDQGRGPQSNVASKRVPFAAAPADTPNLSVQ